MSNVLIGIIGVILFIGLALAGALFLGPRFQESSVNARASAIVQTESQIAHASNLYRTMEGRILVVGEYDAELIGKGYMKSHPGGYGLANNTPANSGPIELIQYAIPDSNAQKICSAINRQNGGDGTIPDAASPTGPTQVGCVKLSAVWAGQPIGTYVAYVTV